MFYNVTYVIGLYIYPRNPTNTVKITWSFVQSLEYDQALILSTSQCSPIPMPPSFFHYLLYPKLQLHHPHPPHITPTVVSLTQSNILILKNKEENTIQVITTTLITVIVPTIQIQKLLCSVDFGLRCTSYHSFINPPTVSFVNPYPPTTVLPPCFMLSSLSNEIRPVSISTRKISPPSPICLHQFFHLLSCLLVSVVVSVLLVTMLDTLGCSFHVAFHLSFDNGDSVITHPEPRSFFSSEYWASIGYI